MPRLTSSNSSIASSATRMSTSISVRMDFEAFYIKSYKKYYNFFSESEKKFGSTANICCLKLTLKKVRKYDITNEYVFLETVVTALIITSGLRV